VREPAGGRRIPGPHRPVSGHEAALGAKNARSRQQIRRKRRTGPKGRVGPSGVTRGAETPTDSPNASPRCAGPDAPARTGRSRGANRLSARKMLGSDSKYAERADLHRKGGLARPAPPRVLRSLPTVPPSPMRQHAPSPAPEPDDGQPGRADLRPDRERLEKGGGIILFPLSPGRPSLRRRNAG
jgi:hypothetical protein